MKEGVLEVQIHNIKDQEKIQFTINRISLIEAAVSASIIRKTIMARFFCSNMFNLSR